MEILNRQTPSALQRFLGILSIPILVFMLAAGTVLARGPKAFVVEAPFKKFARKSGVLTYGEVLTAAIDCDGEMCLQLAIPETSRDAIVKQFPQLVGGFGFGTNVVGVTMETSSESIGAATLRVVVRPGRDRIGLDALKTRVDRVMMFLRILGRLSERMSESLNPRRVAEDRKIYFIYRLTFERTDESMTALLLGPPKAPPPERKKGGRMNRCHRVAIEEAGEMNRGVFSGWNQYLVSWNWICNENGKPIE